VAATTVGQTVPEAAAQTAQLDFPGQVGGFVWTAVSALPLALLEFAVLRWVLALGRRPAIAWAVVTVLASAAAGLVTIFWFEDLVSSQLALGLSDSELNLLFAASEYLYPLLIGFAQGVVLAIVVERRSIVLIWPAANVIALLVSIYATSTAMSMSGFNAQTAPGGMALPNVILWIAYGALTGGTLVALTREPLRATVRAPAAR
jgi:hypothetical protein